MVRRTTQNDLAFHNARDSGIGRITAAARLLHNIPQPPRTLDCYAFVYLIRGEGYFGDDRGLRADVRVGDGFFLFPGVEHFYGPPQGWTWDELYLLFEGPVFDLWTRQGLLNPRQPLHRLEPVDVWARQILELWEGRPDPLDQICRLQGFLMEVLKGGDRSESTEDGGVWLARARRLLSDNAVAPDGVRQTARDMGISYQAFRKTFRRLAGIPPGQYRTRSLLDAAARRLLTESTPVKQIADDLGYCDEFHFNRMFRKHHGTPPAAYRRRIRSPNHPPG